MNSGLFVVRLLDFLGLFWVLCCSGFWWLDLVAGFWVMWICDVWVFGFRQEHDLPGILMLRMLLYFYFQRSFFVFETLNQHSVCLNRQWKSIFIQLLTKRRFLHYLCGSHINILRSKLYQTLYWQRRLAIVDRTTMPNGHLFFSVHDALTPTTTVFS